MGVDSNEQRSGAPNFRGWSDEEKDKVDKEGASIERRGKKDEYRFVEAK